MTVPDFPGGNSLETGLELAFGADIDGDQNNWDWVDLTPAGDSIFMRQTVTTTRGRQDESSDVAPTGASMDLDNPIGDLTPDNAASQYYPNVDLGTPARWWIKASTPRLYLRPQSGSQAHVNSVSTLNLTSDLDLRIDMHLKTMDPSAAPAAIAGRADTTSTFSWRLMVYPDRTVELQWSPTGTAPILSIRSTTPVVPMSARSTVRVTLDVDNGAGGRTAVFYTAPDVTGPFTQVGPSVVQAGVTSINNATQPLIVGHPPDLGVAYASDANVYVFRLRNGIAGPSVAYADFTAQASGATSFVDTAGRTWHMDAPNAELSNRWFRIVGTVDAWAPRWPVGDISSQMLGGLTEGQARVGIEVAGVLRRLGQGATPLASAIRRAILAASNILAYWPMEDAAGSTQLASGIPGGAPMAIGGEINLASDSTLLGSEALPALTATTSLSGAVTGHFNGTWRVDFYVNAATGPASPTTILTVSTTTDASAPLWVVQISAGAVAITGYTSSGGVFSTATGTPTDMFGGWAHLQLQVWQQGTDVNMKFSWSAVAYPAASIYTLSTNNVGVVGNVVNVGIPASALLAGVAVGQMTVGRLFNVVVVGNAETGWTGETAAARLTRLFAEEGVYFRIIGEPTTTEQMGPQQMATLLTLADDAENADGGVLYEMSDAVGLIYRTRESMYNQPPNMILDAHLSQVANPFLPVLDDQKIRNDITITRRGGSSYRAIDQASIDKHGDYPDGLTLNLWSDTQNQSAAGWALHQGIVPGMRYPSLATNLGVAPEVIDDWLTVDQGAQVHAINLPPQHPVGTVKVVAEGYGEPISPFTWDPEMNCSPASVWDVTALDGTGVIDAYLLRLETDGSQLAEAIDSTDTTFRVVVLAGPQWVTAGGEFPFDINIAGEQMAVASIGAVAGGAIFTGAGNAGVVNTNSHVAPSVVAVASGDLLVCAWMSFASTGTYTVPGAMTAAAPTSGTFTTMRTANQTLGAAGATGTRTATFSASDRFSATSVAVHADSGSPTVVEYISSIRVNAAVTVATTVAAVPGDWLMAINSWDWDPGDVMNGPSPLDGWTAVADSTLANNQTSRTQVWVKRIDSTNDGVQSVTFPIAGGVTDNHARLYLLRGLIGPTQLFTVTRSVNGIVKAHSVTESVTLWNTPVLAR